MGTLEWGLRMNMCATECTRTIGHYAVHCPVRVVPAPLLPSGIVTQRNPYTEAWLDRRAEARLDPDWLVEARRDARTLYLVMRQGMALVRPGVQGDFSRLAFL